MIVVNSVSSRYSLNVCFYLDTVLVQTNPNLGGSKHLIFFSSLVQKDPANSTSPNVWQCNFLKIKYLLLRSKVAWLIPCHYAIAHNSSVLALRPNISIDTATRRSKRELTRRKIAEYQVVGEYQAIHSQERRFAHPNCRLRVAAFEIRR